MTDLSQRSLSSSLVVAERAFLGPRSLTIHLLFSDCTSADPNAPPCSAQTRLLLEQDGQCHRRTRHHSCKVTNTRVSRSRSLRTCHQDRCSWQMAKSNTGHITPLSSWQGVCQNVRIHPPCYEHLILYVSSTLCEARKD